MLEEKLIDIFLVVFGLIGLATASKTAKQGVQAWHPNAQNIDELERRYTIIFRLGGSSFIIAGLLFLIDLLR